MKALTKALVLAPVVLLSLTACGKLSDEKAQERINGYSLSDVAAKYASVDIKSDVKVNKRTGVFAEDGALAAIVNTVIKALDQSAEGAAVAEGFFTMDAIDAGEAAADNDDINLEYYGYKKTGLKIVATTKSEVDSGGLKEKTDSKSTVYVLDDGRMEKGNGSMKMSASGSYLGFTAEGSLDISYKVSYKWNAK